MVAYTLHKARDKKELSQLTSQVIATEIITTLSTKERFLLSLSGGSTPSMAYSLLGQERLPWNRVDILLGDERWVSTSDELSNALMLRKTLLASGPGEKACFHTVPTIELDSPKESANYFSKLLLQVCTGSPPTFDLILLGLGDDGHTASLFPWSDSLKVKNVYATVGEGKGQARITLTHEVLSAASKVIFLVSGASKQIALKRLLDPKESYERTPAKLVNTKSEILILADEDAAKLI